MRATLSRINAAELNLSDKLIYINRVTKVVKGGKRLSFAALVVTGDGAGHVGLGEGKANEVPAAINKASANAKKNLAEIRLKGATIPHQIQCKFGAAQVFLKPAAPGTGVIAGGSVRAVLVAAGVKDILSKSLGSANRVNVAKATIQALETLRDPKETVNRRRAMLAGEAVASG